MKHAWNLLKESPIMMYFFGVTIFLGILALPAIFMLFI